MRAKEGEKPVCIQCTLSQGNVFKTVRPQINLEIPYSIETNFAMATVDCSKGTVNIQFELTFASEKSLLKRGVVNQLVWVQ